MFSLVLLLRPTCIFVQQESKSLARSPVWTSKMVRSLQPDNPWMAAGGASSEHDAYSSNVSPQSGPGSGAIRITVTTMGAIWPAIFWIAKQRLSVCLLRGYRYSQRFPADAHSG